MPLWCLQASGESTKNGYAQEMIEMLKKMKSSDYYLPESLGLTPECKALLHKLLHPDWTKRVKIPEIMADPWFRTDLPPDALNMNERYLANTRTCTQTEAGGCSSRRLGIRDGVQGVRGKGVGSGSLWSCSACGGQGLL